MNQTRLILLIAASTFSVCPLLSQNPAPKTSFEVISIKPTLPGNSPRGGGPRGDRFSMTGATLKMLLQSAYQRSTPGTDRKHTSELQSPCNLVCRLLLEKKKKTT